MAHRTRRSSRSRPGWRSRRTARCGSRFGRSGVVRVEAVAAACDHDGDAGEASMFAACHRYREEWEIDVRVVADGATTLQVDLDAG
jgi:hypothetical protein